MEDVKRHGIRVQVRIHQLMCVSVSDKIRKFILKVNKQNVTLQLLMSYLVENSWCLRMSLWIDKTPYKGERGITVRIKIFLWQVSCSLTAESLRREIKMVFTLRAFTGLVQGYSRELMMKKYKAPKCTVFFLSIHVFKFIF